MKSNRSIPIIAMTAHGEQYLQSAKNAGADATLKKPEQIGDLPMMIRQLLRKPNSWAARD
ncbi:MAG TPA: hypothetical protein VFC63_14120 [Blastocatellia bacterium]|nr:hypothetical protein [Blastocatellia bacterium]